MRKALNFDLDTKKYEENTGKHSPTAYVEIKRFLEKMLRFSQSFKVCL